MLRCSRSVFAAVVVLVCVAGAQASVIAFSNFSTGADGWRVAGDAQGEGLSGNLGTPTWQAAGGQAGGGIISTDDGMGGTWYWVAPVAYLGDVSAAYGGAIAFDMKVTNHGNWHRPDLVLTSDGLTITHQLDRDPTKVWGHFDVPFTAGGWINEASGQAATAAEIRQVLGDLTSLWIRGEFYNGHDQGCLDNVEMTTGGEAPEPAALALLAAGGLFLLRRRRAARP